MYVFILADGIVISFTTLSESSFPSGGIDFGAALTFYGDVHVVVGAPEYIPDSDPVGALIIFTILSAAEFVNVLTSTATVYISLDIVEGEAESNSRFGCSVAHLGNLDNHLTN